MSFFEPKKARSRRNEIRDEVRRHRQAPARRLGGLLRDEKTLLCLTVALAFAVTAASLLMLRPRVLPLKPGQTTRGPIVSRVGFDVADAGRLQQARADAAASTPPVFAPAEVDPIVQLRTRLLALPQRLVGLTVEQAGDLERELGSDANVIDGASLAKLQAIAAGFDSQWPDAVEAYAARLRRLNLVVLPVADARNVQAEPIALSDSGRVVSPGERLVPPGELDDDVGEANRGELRRKLTAPAAECFPPLLAPKIVELTLETLGATHRFAPAATAEARQRAEAAVPASAGAIRVLPGQSLLSRDHTVSESDWELLVAENAAYRASLGGRVWIERLGLFLCVLMVTAALAIYAAHYQPRVVKNPIRAAGLALLLLASLLVAQLAALGTGSTQLLGVGPILLAAMTLCVAYDGRFGLGVGAMLALLVTLGLGEGIGFFLVAFAGLLVSCFLLREVRTRSKLIEVGGLTGLVVGAAALAVSMVRMDNWSFALTQAAWATLGGFAAGGLVLCALPFIERVFKITTGLTLLEYQDHPLLRRLALEAPGTYNHSLQVANLSEEAANAIEADSLLCRVACYYHDIGKLRKPEYFIENQQVLEPGRANPHLTLNPSMSLLVIIGHVKDGLAMAREWSLPRAFLPFIEQHHGTTLVEYFYREACQQQKQRHAEGQIGAEDQPADCDYRYPGPRPRSRETAIVMLADCCESAVRAMAEPTPNRIEGRVNDLVQKRLLDRQFDECPLTLGELEKVRKSLVKSLVAVYHGRVPYPSDAEKPERPQATRIVLPPGVSPPAATG